MKTCRRTAIVLALILTLVCAGLAGVGCGSKPPEVAPRQPGRSDVFLTEQGRELARGRTDGASEYAVEATLDVRAHTVAGSERVSYTNGSADTRGEVVFRVYADAPEVLPEGGAVTISDVTVDGGSATFELEGSFLHVKLPAGLEPQKTAMVAFDFKEPVPAIGSGKTGDIFGYKDDTYNLGNFLPTVARYENGSWDTRESPVMGDVNYFDCSYYTVTFTAPADYVVAATGVEEENEKGVHRYSAGPVRDFEVQASRDYEVEKRQVGPTTISSYFLEESPETGSEALDFGCQALERYSKHFGAYPYTGLNICEAPIKSYGMEFTGQVQVGDFLYTDPEEVTQLELTVAHEVCHEWWALGVGSDSIGHPWQDESLTNYCDILYFYWQHNAQTADENLRSDLVEPYVELRRQETRDAPVDQPVAAFDEDQYGMIIYSKGALFFNELWKLSGEALADTELAGYYRDHVFLNAGQEDLLGALKSAAADPAAVDALYQRWIKEVHGDADVPGESFAAPPAASP